MTRVAPLKLAIDSAFSGLGRLFGSSSVVLLLILALLGCSPVPLLATPNPPTVDAAARTVLPESTARPSSPVTPLASRIPSLDASETITLTVWAPEEMSPEAAQGGAVLRRQVDAFTQANAGIRVRFVLKSAHGTGGLMDFLTKVKELVPDRLPDIIVIDSRELDTAAREGLLQGLDQDFPSGSFADLFPPVQSLAKYRGEWLSMPVAVDVQHLAYNTKTVATPPATWDDMLKGSATFAFPADDDDAFLYQYMENQGRIADSAQPSPLNLSVTTSVLTFYQRARTANLVPDSVLSVKTVHDVWPVFAEGQVALAQVEASDYIAEHGRVPNSGYAPLPTQDGEASTLVSAWNYAIITPDTKRHAAAAAFLDWVDEPSRLGEWAAAAQVIPARRSAFALSVAPQAYGDFLLKLLETGIVAPTFSERQAYSSSWHAALQSVLRGQSTPGEAALRAAQALAP